MTIRVDLFYSLPGNNVLEMFKLKALVDDNFM